MKLIKRVYSKVDKYFEIFKVSFITASTYGKEIFGTLGFLIIILFILFFLWKAIFSFEKMNFAGFTLQKILWYVAATEAIMLSGSRIRIRIDEEIRSGNVANFLIKPFFYPMFLAFDSLGSSIFRFIIRVPVAFILALIYTSKLEFSTMGFVSFIILAFLGLFLDALIAVLIGLLAFFIEDTSPVYWIYNKLLFTIGGLLIPIEIMPNAVKNISKFFPTRFVLYNPAMSFVNFSRGFFLQSLFGSAICIIIISIFTCILFSFASRRLSINGG